MRNRPRWDVRWLLVAGVLFASGNARAQQAHSGLAPVQAPVARPARASKLPPVEHRFFDRTNLELFAGVAAVRALDYTSTRHFRDRGVNEALLSNAIVDNQPLFAGIEVAGAAASVALSYWLHRTGHHKIERWVSIVHIGVAGFGDIRNYTLKNSQPVP
jgi:hypothetical protein